MTIFRPDQSRSVVSSWINSNLDICPHEIQSAIEHEKNEEDLDLNLGFGSVAIGILSSAVVLGLAGVSVAMIPSIALAVVGSIHGYNAGIQSRRRELEGEFISKHPEVLDSIKLVLDHGQPVHKVASGFESIFRLYRRGHDSEILEAIAEPKAHPSAKPIEKSGPEIASRDGNQTHTQIEFKPIEDKLTPFILNDDNSITRNGIRIGFPETPKTRSELIARLKKDCPLLLKLVKSHPIRAVGVQRSGKTTLVKRLALLRMVLLEGHSVTASTPHYEEINQYPDVFDVAGIRNGKRDYPAIERAWSKMASDVESCQMGNVTYIWDEFGLIDKAILITPESDPIKSVLTSCLRETMKFQIYPIFILHGETAAFLPGSKGLVTVIMASTVRVETIGEAVEGDDGLEMIRPTGKFSVTWLDGSKAEGILPAWLSEDFLIGMIPARNSDFDRRENLESLFQNSEIQEPKNSDENYTDNIKGTWRERFAKDLPPNLSESEFMARYQLEKSLQECSEIEASAIVDHRPEGLKHYTLVELIWQYLHGKEDRNLKQISDAFRKSGQISEDDLREHLGDILSYKEGIKSVLLFGVHEGFIDQVSEDVFREIQKH